jgi:hypothetical protein
MRIGLSDPFGRQFGVSSPFSVPVALDDDRPGSACGCDDGLPGDPDSPAPPVAGMPTLTLKARARKFRDEDGTLRFDWTTVTSGPAFVYKTRVETNDATGQTMEKAEVALAWSGDEGLVPPKETAVVFDEAGARWEVTSLLPAPGRLNILMERIDEAP